MADRLELQEILRNVLGSQYVYFQPPNNLEMQYPCIVYRWDRAATKFADNKRYKGMRGYQVTVLDKDPDSEIPEQIAELPMSLFDRTFVSDKVYHFVYNIFF